MVGFEYDLRTTMFTFTAVLFEDSLLASPEHMEAREKPCC